MKTFFIIFTSFFVGCVAQNVLVMTNDEVYARLTTQRRKLQLQKDLHQSMKKSRAAYGKSPRSTWKLDLRNFYMDS